MGDGLTVEIPHLVADRVIVGIDDVVILVAMARNMELHDTVARDALQKVVRGKAVVERAHIDIVDVEQEPTIGAVRHLGDEFPLAHFRLAERHIARNILQCQATTEHILHLAHAVDHVIERFFGIGNRQQVMQVHAVHARPTQMVGNPFRIDALSECFEVAEIVHIERCGRGDGHRHAMHHDWIAFANLIEDVERLAARNHVVLGEHLEPINGRRAA